MVLRYTKSGKESMYALVRQWEGSGMTQLAFAAQNNIRIDKLRYWIEKHRKQTIKTSDFIELPINIPQPQSQEIILRYPSGIELVFPVDFPIESIKALVAC